MSSPFDFLRIKATSYVTIFALKTRVEWRNRQCPISAHSLHKFILCFEGTQSVLKQARSQTQTKTGYTLYNRHTTVTHDTHSHVTCSHTVRHERHTKSITFHLLAPASKLIARLGRLHRRQRLWPCFRCGLVGPAAASCSRRSRPGRLHRCR